jgi:hypothetical protein
LTRTYTTTSTFPRISRRGAFRGAIRGQKIAIPHGPPASGEVQRDSSFLHCTKQHGAPHQTARYEHCGGTGGGLKKKKRGQNFVRVRSGAVHHGRWPMSPLCLQFIHSQTRWGGYLGGLRASAPVPGHPESIRDFGFGWGSAKTDGNPAGITGVRRGIVGACGGGKSLHLDVEGEKSRKR